MASFLCRVNFDGILIMQAEKIKHPLSHIAVFKNNSARLTKQGDLHSFFMLILKIKFLIPIFQSERIFFGHTAPSFGQIFILTKK